MRIDAAIQERPLAYRRWDATLGMARAARAATVMVGAFLATAIAMAAPTIEYASAGVTMDDAATICAAPMGVHVMPCCMPNQSAHKLMMLSFPVDSRLPSTQLGTGDLQSVASAQLDVLLGGGLVRRLAILSPLSMQGMRESPQGVHVRNIRRHLWRQSMPGSSEWPLLSTLIAS